MSFGSRIPEDVTFERRLLQSAHGDALPRDIGEAWSRFTENLGLLAIDPRLALAERAARVRATAPTARAGRLPVPRNFALKWLLVGALGGSGLTAGVLSEQRRHELHRPITNIEPVAPVRAADRPPAGGGGAEIDTEEKPARDASRVRPHHGGLARRTVTTPGERSKVDGPSSSPASSTLAAEVSRIDTARTALAIGDCDEAMRVIERYHRDFPDGVLAPDADVVALEAAAAKPDLAELSERARGFLARYPNDPHAARVRRLAKPLLER